MHPPHFPLPKSFLVLCFLGTLAGLARAGGAAELRLRAECSCDGAVVTLGDLAEVVGTDRQAVESLAAVELFAAPSPGQKRFVRLREIQDLLLLRGVNLTQHRFSGYAQVTVTGKETAEPAAERGVSPLLQRQAKRRLQEALREYLRRQAGTDSPWEFQIQLDDREVSLLVDAGATTSVAGGNPPWSGLQRFRVTVQSAAGPQAFALDVEVRLPPSMVVAVRSLSRGALVRADDVALRPMAVSDDRAEGLRSLEQAVGRETTRAIPEGSLLTDEMLRRPLLVRRGEVVTVCARSPGIRVQTMARARDDGALGDLVAVESLQDRSVYFVRVSKLREGEVYARSMKATR